MMSTGEKQTFSRTPWLLSSLNMSQETSVLTGPMEPIVQQDCLEQKHSDSGNGNSIHTQHMHFNRSFQAIQCKQVIWKSFDVNMSLSMLTSHAC